jgi:Phage portal protein, SPP1 Gp6-like
MDITDRAARTILRTEISAEFYASPQRYILGADEEAWSGTDKWKAVMGRFLALTKDEDGDTPTVGQFQQMTMQPHLDMLRQLAGQFAGETGVPISSLGIVQDNPSSAEAIYAAKEDLIVEAQAANRIFGAALGRVAQRVVQLRDGLDQPSSDLRRIQARWNNPAFPSPVSAADALVKIATVFPWLGDSEVALERAGFTQPEITRLLSDKRRSQGVELVAALSSVPAPAAAPDGSADTAMKAKFDALGIAIRSGVSPESAAAALGLPGLEFSGAIPVSLRPPKDEAQQLEQA